MVKRNVDIRPFDLAAIDGFQNNIVKQADIEHGHFAGITKLDCPFSQELRFRCLKVLPFFGEFRTQILHRFSRRMEVDNKPVGGLKILADLNSFGDKRIVVAANVMAIQIEIRNHIDAFEIEKSLAGIYWELTRKVARI